MADLKISQLTSATTPLAGTEVVPLVQSSTTRKVAVSDLTAGRAVAAQELNLTKADATVYTPTNTLAAGVIEYVKNTSTTNSTAATLRIEATGSSDLAAASISAVHTGAGQSALTFGTRLNGSSDVTENMRISGAGDVTLKTGNLVQGTAAKGINFTANTPAAGMTSQLLNWYEEGTWTPTDQSGAGLTFTITDNKYTRTGRLVQVNALITWPTTASTGNVTLGGLPFTCGNYSLGQIVGFFGVSGCVTIPSGGTLFYFRDLTGNLLQNSAFSGKDVAVSVCYMV